MQTIIADLGRDLEKTYFNVPRMQSSTSSCYLTTGIGVRVDGELVYMRPEERLAVKS